jgi:hypothetical protein
MNITNWKRAQHGAAHDRVYAAKIGTTIMYVAPHNGWSTAVGGV